MNVIRATDKDYAEGLERLSHLSSLFDPLIEERTQGIIELVRDRGDEALLELTTRFDGANLRIDQLPISRTELFNASLAADDELRKVVLAAHQNILDRK